MIDQAGIRIAQGKPIACERINGMNDNMTKSHFHNYFELYYLETGERYHMLNDELYHIHAGEFILFAPYIMHHSYGEENMPFRRLLTYFVPSEIDNPEVKEALLEKSGVYKIEKQSSKKIHEIMEALLAEQSSEDEYSDDYQHHLVNVLGLQLLRLEHKRMSPAKNNRISNILTYIHEHYNEDITLELLSQQFFISPYYLCREFKRITNTTVVSYVNTTKIMNAQRKIMETDLNFTQISEITGFSNVTHFNRVFKKMTGMTPSEYRKEMKKNRITN